MPVPHDDLQQGLAPARMYGSGMRRTILAWTRPVSTIIVLYVILFTAITDSFLYPLYATHWTTMMIFL